MKYAFMSFSTPQLTLDETLALAARLGYDGFEPRLDSGHAHGIERGATAADRARIRDASRRAGVAIACVATSCRFADPAGRVEAVDTGHQAIDLAGDVGCDRLRVFGGNLPGGMTREAAREGVAEGLSALADHAAERGVVLCVETHDDWTQPDEVARLMEQVGHPAVAVNWDVMHTQRQGRVGAEEAFDRLRPWVRYVHVHDGVDTLDRLEMRPIGRGDFDHRAVVRVLKAAGYDGYLSGEWIEGLMPAEFYADHLGPELATLRRYEQEVA